MHHKENMLGFLLLVMVSLLLYGLYVRMVLILSINVGL